MASKLNAYVDTSALIALLDKSDSFHSLFSRLFSDPPPLVTSSLVVAEGQGWFLRRFDTNRSLQFLTFLEELPNLTIFSVGELEIKEGQRVLQKFSDQTLTLADAVGIALIKKHKIRRCWSTDRHLSLGGVPLITSLVD